MNAPCGADKRRKKTCKTGLFESLKEAGCQAFPRDDLNNKVYAQDNEYDTHDPAREPYGKALSDHSAQNPNAAFTAFLGVAVPAGRYKVFRIVDVCDCELVQQPFHDLAALHSFHRKQVIYCDLIFRENPAAVGTLIIRSLMVQSHIRAEKLLPVIGTAAFLRIFDQAVQLP